MKKLRAAIYGFAVGDALGVPFEFKTRGDFHCRDMIGYGTWNQPAGTWSDDTSMTLATCDSIREKGHIDYEDLMQKFLDWRFDNQYTATGKVFDCGNTTSDALWLKRQRIPALSCGRSGVYDNGNGSLMRMLPLAFIDCTDEEIKNVSSLTHAHDISTKICVEYIQITRDLLAGKNLLETFEGSYHVYKCVSESTIRSTGYVVDTFSAAKWALINSTSYADCVLKAVNLGGDTDTIAAIAGGWAGILYGYKSIPKAWRKQLKNKKLINACIKWR